MMGLVFLWAGLAKFIWPSRSDPATAHFETIHGSMVAQYPSLGPMLMTAEMFLGIWLLTGLYARTVCGLVVGALSAASVILAHELTQNVPRACGCISQVPLTPHEARWSLVMALSRNVLLMASATWIVLGAAGTMRPSTTRKL
jgi:uncharacterized membrane protein YphA (DoxX/SURF4 family)